MATTTDVRKMPVAATADMMRPPRSLWKDAWYQFRRHTLAMAGTVTLIILILGTTLGPFVYTTPINDIDFSRAIEGPSPAHPFGTDDLGRDIMVRVAYGARISLIVGVVAGSAVISPVLNLLARAYGFAGAANVGVVAQNPLPAPQATLISALAQGVIGGSLNWTMICIGARVGAEIQFGFIGIPQLALQGTVGVHLTYEGSSISLPNNTELSAHRFGFGTTVQGKPWDIFTSNISAIYYF